MTALASDMALGLGVAVLIGYRNRGIDISDTLGRCTPAQLDRFEELERTYPLFAAEAARLAVHAPGKN